MTNAEKAQAAERKAREALAQWREATDAHDRERALLHVAQHWQAAAFFWRKALEEKQP